MWRSTLYRQLVSSRGAGGRPSAELLRPPDASPRVSPPSSQHASRRRQNEYPQPFAPHTAHSPGAQARRSSVRSAPSSSTSLSPRGGDGPKSTLSHRCDRVSACDSGTWPDGSARLVGRLTTWPNNLPFRRARHPFLFLPWFLQEESHHVFGTHLPEGSWQGRESPPCCVRH